MNVLYIGEIGDAVTTLFALLKVASKVVIINTDLTHFYDDMPDMKIAIGNKCRVWDFYKSSSILEKIIPPKIRKLWRYVKCLLGISIYKLISYKSKESRIIKNIIEEENIEIVFAAWGTDVIPDIMFLRTIYPNIPIVHYLPTFPTSQTSWLREEIEIFLFRKIVHHVNGFIAASKKMKEFLINKYKLDANSILVCPIFFTAEYFAKEKLLTLSESDGEPHLACTGSTNIAYPGNNVLGQILEIANKNIHVHCIRIENQNISNPNVHFFEKYDPPSMADGSLATFLTQFDGCLVLYNASTQRLRYELSIPQRFLLCFTTGIPIFMPKGIFRSCEEIIEKYQNGIVYASVEELNRVLNDPKVMKILKDKASVFSHDFAFETQAEQFSSFLFACCNN